MTPIPPACAMAMASRASVTVSIAEETIGRLMRIVRVSLVPMLAALGMIVLMPGLSSTSSNASPSGKPVSMLAIAVILRPTPRAWSKLHPSYGAAA